MFTKVLNNEWEIPSEWTVSYFTVFIVLFKTGDSKLPGNYRPITLLPILYKLFSRILYMRIGTTLALAQAVDQAGFRSGYSCDDHQEALFMEVVFADDLNAYGSSLKL